MNLALKQKKYMSIQDPIANLFSSINNAQGRYKETVKVPSSTKKLALLSMLKQEGYIHSYSSSEGAKPEIGINIITNKVS